MYESRDFTVNSHRFLPFLSGNRIVPAAGIDEELDGLGEELGGATGCVVHVVAEG